LAQKDAQACQQLHEVEYEKNRWCLHLVTENGHFEQQPLQSQANAIFARRYSKIVLPLGICEVVATSMVSFRVI
jgi:hypothetical protein